jgi:predicted Zn-dependent protease
MNTDFRPTDATLPRYGCACCRGRAPDRARRLFTGALLAGAAELALAREGVEVGPPSSMSKLVSADQVEQAAVTQYRDMLKQAGAKNALAPPDHPQVVRLRAISQRLIPYTYEWNPRAREWKWEVNVIGSQQINAFCMPGGKIAFYFGILDKLQLTDDECAMVMGHEMTHALREHARAQMGKNAATRLGTSVVSSLLGLGNIGDAVLNMGGQLLTLKFGRQDESEADLIGMELAARGGYDPHAGVTLWNKMSEASKGAPPQFLSTHPSGPTRIRDIERNIPEVQSLYDKAAKPTERFEPPKSAKKPTTPSRETSR